MTLIKEITLPAKAEARPKRGAKGSWFELAPGLWLTKMPDLQEVLSVDPKGGQVTLSYDFSAARISPPTAAKQFPRQATRMLARARALLDEKLATLLVESAGRERLEPAGFPSLNWPGGTSFSSLAKQREMHRNRSLALKHFLSAAHVWNEVSEEDVASNIILRIKALNLPVPSQLSLHLDGEGGKAELRLVLEDAGLAIPGSGRIVLADIGYGFESYPETQRAGLCIAYAQALAQYLARSAYTALNGIPLSGQVEVRVGSEFASIELSEKERAAPVS